MIPVSEAYKQIAESNIRPRTIPKIRVFGTDANGEEIEIIWTPSELKSFEFVRAIDPMGRELPIMRLTWSEIYKGRLNENAYPEKYNNLLEYLAVELSFEQHLEQKSTWKGIFQGSKKWSDFFRMTWKAVKKKPISETITFPKMFLTAKPKISGQTITWVAEGLLHFLDSMQTKKFDSGIPFVNPMRYLVLNERGSFSKASSIITSIEETDAMLGRYQEATQETEDNNCILEGYTKDLLVNYAQTHNIYWNYLSNGLVVKKIEDLLNEPSEVVLLAGKIMYSFPVINKTPNVSAYNFKRYKAEIDTENTYNKRASEVFSVQGVNVYRVLYDGYGDAENTELEDVNYCLLTEDQEVTIAPIVINPQSCAVMLNKAGEVYSEDNPLWQYPEDGARTLERVRLIEKYFDGSSQIRFNGLSNLAIESGDWVNIETNLYKSNGERVVKKGIVVEIKLKFNGALRQEMLIHEVLV